MKKFRVNSIIFISVIAVIFGCNVYYLIRLYESIRKNVEREVLTALADTDIDDMWERSERARMSSRNQTELESVSGSIDDDGNFATKTHYRNGETESKEFPLVRGHSYSNQMMKSMSQQMHESMDKYYGYDLDITDSIFRNRLADRQIYPDFVAIEIVDANDSVLLGNNNLPPDANGYDVLRLCFNPEKGWIYRANITPLTGHILSQMLGVIVTLFLLMTAFGAAFYYLFRTVSKLRTIEEMKDDFINNMTHELKTPVSIAYSANDALLNYDTTNDPEKKVTYLKIALKQLKRLGELVENILAMSMERRKTMVVKSERIAVAELVNEIAEAQRMRTEKELTIEVRVNENAVVTGDISHFSNVLNNLIDNAVKYSAKAVNIVITGDTSGISVADNGIGIPAKCLPYIFDKFYRVPHGNRQDVRGYGIGLYYVKQILEKMNWSIYVTSQENVGTTFTIKFHQDEK